MLRVMVTGRPLCRCGAMWVWSADAGGNPSDLDRVAEHIVPADRCAREIGGFLKVVGGALAAAELHRWAYTINRVAYETLNAGLSYK